MKKICLTIAGSDSSGGAGIQADIKAMEANGVFAMSVITGITAQNSHSIPSVKLLNKTLVASQIDCLFTDYKIAGVKIGALFNSDLIKLVASKLKTYKPLKIVLDPVMVSKSKTQLLANESISVFMKAFANMKLLLTPNIDEAEKMLGFTIRNNNDMKVAIAKLQNRGFKNVLLKGGHLSNVVVTNYFGLADSKKVYKVEHPRIQTKNTHGTGCSLASAIVALWVQTNDLKKAIRKAIDYVHIGIANGLDYGKGFGPINHFWKDKDDFKRK